MTYLVGLRQEPFAFESDFLAELIDTEWESEIDRKSADYIRWVQQSLSLMMGKPLPQTGVYDEGTRKAVRTVQSQLHLGRDGVVGKNTERGLVRAIGKQPPGITTPISITFLYPEVNTPLPRSGPGFYSYKPSFATQFGLSETIQALQSVAAKWQSRHPQGPRIGIGDISLRGGGDIPGHKSHEQGVDIDILPVRNDGKAGRVTWNGTDRHNYSQPFTQELVNLIRSNGILRVGCIFFNDPSITGVQFQKNHDNHLHIRFCVPNVTKCTCKQIKRIAKDFEFDEMEEENENWDYEAALDILSPSELKAVKITSTFETGHPGGFGGLTGNFDGQGLSFGLLNFTIKAGSLIPLLQEFIKKYPERYAAAFGNDAHRFRDIVFATKPDPKSAQRTIRDVERQMEFVNTQMNLMPKKARGNQIVEPWKTYFSRLENDQEFRKIQVKAVRRVLDRARRWFDYFGFKTERGFAFMFDLVSSHGGAWLDASKFKGRRRAQLRKMLADKKQAVGRDTLTELEKMEVIANMIANASLPEWREKVRVRKMWFVRGSGKVHKKFYNIGKDFGISDNPPEFSSSSTATASEWQGDYSEGELQFEQNVTAPSLLDHEKTAIGDTLYVKIGLGINKAPNKIDWNTGKPTSDAKFFQVHPMTGIFIPQGYIPQPEIDIVLYLHGHKGARPGNGASIQEYLNSSKFPYFGLREEVKYSGQNVIFVAPTLGPLSQAGNLTTAQGFDNYLAQVLTALDKYYVKPNSQPKITGVRRIILAAHSGGGRPMLRMAMLGGSSNASKISECWGFDSVYGTVEKSWVSWAKAHPNAKLYFYSQGTAKRSKTLEKMSKQKGIKNVCVHLWNGQDFTNWSKTRPPLRKSDVGAHFWVPIVYLMERLRNTPCRTSRAQSEFEIPFFGDAGNASNFSTLKTNIVRLANQEWGRWNVPNKRFERDPRMRKTLLDYWHTGPRKQVQSNDLGSKLWQSKHPWSATFISWVMRKSAANGFNYSSAHAAYIKAAKDNRLANNANPFKAYRISEVKPVAGDLVCKSRAGSGATYENIRRGMKTHCDIVTQVEPGQLTTIGGNVGNSVSKTTVPLDSNGQINDPRYFAVIKVG